MHDEKQIQILTSPICFPVAHQSSSIHKTFGIIIHHSWVTTRGLARRFSVVLLALTRILHLSRVRPTGGRTTRGADNWRYASYGRLG